MKIFNRGLVAILTSSFLIALAGPIAALAATTPSLGAAATYGVLGSTYTDTSAATTVNGDVGFTTPPASSIAGVHTNYGSGAPYATAGIDQAAALATLNSAPCDFTFGAATDLSLLSQPLTPGVYCVTGAQSIGTGGITLVSGTYIFRSTGALNTVANSAVTGGSACDVFWTPTATTLGANSTFFGTDIDPSGITVGAVTNWVGRALAFGGTVTTDTDGITVPTCAVVTPTPPAPALATLHVIKLVVNGNGGTAVPSDFLVHVKSATSSLDVSGSPATGTSSPGTLYSLSAGTYVVSENANASYVQSFSGDCGSSGIIALASGDATCTIINTDIPVPVPVPAIPQVSGGGNGPIVGSLPAVFNAPGAVLGVSAGNVALGAVLGVSTSTVSVPGFPNTGLPPEEKSVPWNVILIFCTLALLLGSLAILRKHVI